MISQRMRGERYRDPASYTDPSGHVFWQDGQVFRYIHPDQASFFSDLLAHPVAKSLQDEGLLVGTRLHERSEHGMVLAHDAIWSRSYPQEWCAPMLRDAALAILEVASRLAEAGFELMDGHPWNVFFHRGRPTFIDVGSIGPARSPLLWGALAQFNRFGLYPLRLIEAGLPELARARLTDLTRGISADLALRSLSLGYKLGHPAVYARLRTEQLVHRWTERSQALHQETRPSMASVDREMLQRIRSRFFAGLKREVQGITVAKAGSDWARYYQQCPSMAEPEALRKDALLERIFSDFGPKSVVDLGTNTGRYAMMAARAGARVVAIDQDEASVAALYEQGRRDGLDVLPVVMDLGNPTPSNGWCSGQRPAAIERFGSDVSLMLALIHHLVFTGNHSLSQIAQLADRVSKRHAVIEWVAMDDPMVRFLRRTATKDFSFYTVENLMAELGEVGFRVETLEPHSATRQLLICSK